MEPKYSEERPAMSLSSRLGSGGRVSSGGTKRQSECPIVSSSTSSSDEETTTTTDYYSYEASVLSPGGESVATNASDTSLSLKVDELTSYRPMCSERSTSAHSQRSSVSSASRHRKKRVTDSGCVAGSTDSSRLRGNDSTLTQNELVSSTMRCKASEPVRCNSAEKQLRSESSFLDVATGSPVAVGHHSPLVNVTSIPVVNTVTVQSAAGDSEDRDRSCSTMGYPKVAGRFNGLEVQVPLAKGAAQSRLLRGRQQKPAESSSVLHQANGPLKLRPLPKSFFQQPNRPSPIPPGVSAYPLLPPLGDEQLTAAAGVATEDTSPKAQRRSTVYVGNLDLLQRLFDRAEQNKERKAKPQISGSLLNASPNNTLGNASYQRKNRSNSLPRAPAACGKLLNADPFLLESITDRFPELTIDQDSLNSSLNGSRTLTLPSLGTADVNYPQLLSELVTQI